MRRPSNPDPSIENPALTNSRRPLEGQILIRANALGIAFTIIAVILLGAVIAYILLGSYTRRTTVSGTLTPIDGAIQIYAPVPENLITKRLVEDGSYVHKGDVLFITSDGRESVENNISKSIEERKSRTFQDRLNNLQKSRANTIALANSTEQGLKQKISALKSQSRFSKEEIEIQVRRVVAAESMLKRYRLLEEQNSTTQLELSDRLDIVAVSKAQKLVLDRTYANLLIDIATATSELDQAKKRQQIEMGNLDRDSALLIQEITDFNARYNAAITSPIDGVVTAISGRDGQIVGAQPVATVIPSPIKLQAQAFAPSSAIGFVKTGQHVHIRYAAFPYQKFGQYQATVREISRISMQPPESGTKGTQIGPSLASFRIIFEISMQNIIAYGEKIPLVAGMEFDASIDLDHRTIIEWLVAPLQNLAFQAT